MTDVIHEGNYLLISDYFKTLSAKGSSLLSKSFNDIDGLPCDSRIVVFCGRQSSGNEVNSPTML